MNLALSRSGVKIKQPGLYNLPSTEGCLPRAHGGLRGLASSRRSLHRLCLHDSAPGAPVLRCSIVRDQCPRQPDRPWFYAGLLPLSSPCGIDCRSAFSVRPCFLGLSTWLPSRVTRPRGRRHIPDRNPDISVLEAASFQVTRFVKFTSGAGCADYNPVCEWRSDWSDPDLRTQLQRRARTQLTVLLAPPTALMPAHDLMEEFFVYF
jgi:hypothetical protein